MSLIAMLHYRKHPRQVKKAYPFAAVAKMEDVGFYYFNFQSVDFNEEKIHGWVYEKGAWVQKQMDYPKVIINASSAKTNEEKEIVKRLKTIATFTSHPVGNKMKVYKKILLGEKFAHYLIPSVPVDKGEDLISFLEDHSKAVMKPWTGNHGKNIVFIEKLNNKFLTHEGLRKRVFEEDELVSYIEQLVGSQKYMLQPFIECKTKAGLSYDFRLHVQKNGYGKWEVTLIYPRISGNSKLISNISSGGYRGELGPFLLNEFGRENLNIGEKLNNFALSFAGHFDSLYPYSFDELGIDVGLDHNQEIRIFEVNWRPGAKHREFEVARRLIPYCKYLANEIVL